MTSRADHEAWLKRLEKAARWVREQIRKRHDGFSHPSHLAAKVLEEADEKFQLESFGVEGWCNDVGTNGVQYLNFGDPYVPTVIIKTKPFDYSVHLARGGWGPYAE